MAGINKPLLSIYLYLASGIPKRTHNWVIVLQYRSIGKGGITLQP